MKGERMKLFHLAGFAASVCCVSLVAHAADPGVPTMMTGYADNGDRVELRFDAAPSHDAHLVVVGNRTGAPPKSFDLSYELVDTSADGLESPVVKLSLPGGETLTIACDPRSDDCHADGYPALGPYSFSNLWAVERSAPVIEMAKVKAQRVR
jgi:hypothetical protein